MEVLSILTTLLLGVMLWDVHRGVTKIAAIAEAIRNTTDALLRRVPPPA